MSKQDLIKKCPACITIKCTLNTYIWKSLRGLDLQELGRKSMAISEWFAWWQRRIKRQCDHIFIQFSWVYGACESFLMHEKLNTQWHGTHEPYAHSPINSLDSPYLILQAANAVDVVNIYVIVQRHWRNRCADSPFSVMITWWRALVYSVPLVSVMFFGNRDIIASGCGTYIIHEVHDQIQVKIWGLRPVKLGQGQDLWYNQTCSSLDFNYVNPSILFYKYFVYNSIWIVW